MSFLSLLPWSSPATWIALLIGLGMLFLWLSSLLESSTGLSSSAEVLASDTSQNRVKTLKDPKTGLMGKPDYLLQERVFFQKKIVPVELKPTRQSRALYPSDEMQLVAYMILCRAAYGSKFAGYGYVRYAEATFRVDLTRKLEQRCIQLIEEVRAARCAEDVPRNHDSSARCGRCPYRFECPDSLA